MSNVREEVSIEALQAAVFDTLTATANQIRIVRGSDVANAFCMKMAASLVEYVKQHPAG